MMGLVLFFILTFTYVSESKQLSRKSEVFEFDEIWRDDILCYGELGCFSDGAPFDEPFFERLYSAEPDSPEEMGIEFRYYAPGKKDIKVLNNFNFNSHISRDRGFNAKVKTKFIIHGFLGGNKPWPVDMKNALMQKEKCNVFIVDWSGGDGPVYPKAVANIRVVGASVGLFIQHLMNVTGLDPQDVHIIGHSLGAHTSGYAGKWVKDKTQKLVGRITGLDPAGPYFNGVDPVVRLDIGDASFVDVIHTNWADSMFSGFGIFEPLGHFDFYPNGGEDQPGCPTAGQAELDIAGDLYTYMSPLLALFSNSPTDSVKEDVDELSCSHGRAYEYFTASMTSPDCLFMAQQCSWWENYANGECKNGQKVQMGYYANKYRHLVKKGQHLKFFLRTSDKPPYCLEKKPK